MLLTWICSGRAFRSCFLQGLLVAGTERWPPFALVDHGSGSIADTLIRALDDLVEVLGRRNRVDLCLAYSRGLPWITQVLVGSETPEQLKDTVSLFASTSALSEVEIATVDARLAELQDFIPSRLLNPVRTLASLLSLADGVHQELRSQTSHRHEINCC